MVMTAGRPEQADSGEASAVLVSEVEGWLARAAAGDELAYARGSLPSWASAPALMRSLHAAGVVQLFQRRDQGVLNYFARRTAKPVRPAAAGPAPTVAAHAAETSPAAEAETRLLDVLKGIAKAKKPCPSNAELARLASLENGDQASYRLRRLRDQGLIRIRDTDWAPGRQVTIAATGHTTAVLIEVPKHGFVGARR